MHTYEVIGRPLRRNNRLVKPGRKIRLSDEDAKVFVDRGRLKPASAKAKDAVEELSEAAPAKPAAPTPE